MIRKANKYCYQEISCRQFSLFFALGKSVCHLILGVVGQVSGFAFDVRQRTFKSPWFLLLARLIGSA
jgi:hypothetical protein